MILETEDMREKFHAINNILNKCTTQAGMEKYHLEEKGMDPNDLENLKKRYIKVFEDMEANAMQVSMIIKSIRSTYKAT